MTTVLSRLEALFSPIPRQVESFEHGQAQRFGTRPLPFPFPGSLPPLHLLICALPRFSFPIFCFVGGGSALNSDIVIRLHPPPPSLAVGSPAPIRGDAEKPSLPRPPSAAHPWYGTYLTCAVRPAPPLPCPAVGGAPGPAALLPPQVPGFHAAFWKARARGVPCGMLTRLP